MFSKVVNMLVRLITYLQRGHTSSALLATASAVENVVNDRQILPGELWGITAYFNPLGYRNKLAHLKRFAAGVRCQGLKLLIIELAFETSAYALSPDDCDRLVQVRGSSIMWQKERLLNIGVQNRPTICDKIVWLDGDLSFENARWVEQTCDKLQRYPVVQPFQMAGWLRADAYSFSGQWSFKDCERVSPSLAFTQSNRVLRRFLALGHRGFAWAYRRNIIDRFGLYDKFILGGGDLAMAWAIYGPALRNPNQDRWLEQNCSPAQIRDFKEWRGDIHREIRGHASYIEGAIYHFWHGTRANRKYRDRNLILKKADFDPTSDICLDDNGCWIWSNPEITQRIQEDVRKYFVGRQEEG
jgi:hypothetical protein